MPNFDKKLRQSPHYIYPSQVRASRGNADNGVERSDDGDEVVTPSVQVGFWALWARRALMALWLLLLALLVVFCAVWTWSLTFGVPECCWLWERWGN